MRTINESEHLPFHAGDGGLRRTEFKIGGGMPCQWITLHSANFEFCTSEPGALDREPFLRLTTVH
jgi:hypothetical protein